MTIEHLGQGRTAGAPGSAPAQQSGTSSGGGGPQVPGAPWLPRGYVPRRDLWRGLDASTQCAVTVVVAPAGAGKTLGMAGWVRQADPSHRTTWVEGCPAWGGAEVTDLLDAAAEGREEPALVVIDDAHLLSRPAVRALDERLNARPERMRVVLLTRWDLGLARLVPELLGNLTVLRGDVLRLDDDELTRLVVAHARTDAAEVVEAIAARTGGWAAATVLAARACATAHSVGDFLDRCRATGAGVAGTVADEAFAGLRPRERHLLLCTAAEVTVTEELACHLTHDPGAGEVLDELERTGLLVNRVAPEGTGSAEEDAWTAGGAHFRVHPLLREVARRRMAARGADPRRARSTVLSAVALDVAHGQAAVGLRRLLDLREHDLAAEVLAAHGPHLVDEAQRVDINRMVRFDPAAVERHPEIWSAVARSLWAGGLTKPAEHWARRVVRLHRCDPGALPGIQALTTWLHLTRSGGEPVGPPVREARELLETLPVPASGDAWRALLLLELGVAENWVGDLAEAERHLGEAVAASRSLGLEGAAREGLTHLAVNQLMAGRERVSLHLCLDSAAGPAHTMTEHDRARVRLAQGLIEVQSLPLPRRSSAPVPLPAPPDDLAGRFWLRILQARTCLLAGDLDGAQHHLEVDVTSRALPPHLRVVLLMERAALAVLMGDLATLRSLAEELDGAGREGEAAWVRAVRADLEGDVRRAADQYVEAARAPCAVQPPTAALALTCGAQLHAFLGDPVLAETLLHEAVELTQGRGLVSPFLGWSAHGTRVGELLGAGPAAPVCLWRTDLRRALGRRPSVVSAFRAQVATAQERDSVSARAVVPPLSTREVEVLAELARGSTYADIGANLFVSENTVKTHVSSLYSKLSVGRRSEALAVARTMHLL